MNGTLERSAALPRCGFAAFFLWALTVAAPSFACSCAQITVADAKSGADVVFAGTVVAVHRVDSADNHEPRVVVDFAVKRVWKGDVAEKFSLHTNLNAYTCEGISGGTQVGAAMLVYGYKQDTRAWKNDKNASPLDADEKLLKSVDDDAITYTASICSRTGGVRLAANDFDRLGEFREYAPLDVLPDRALAEPEEQ